MVIKVNAIDTKVPSTSGLVTKTQYYSEKKDLEKKTEGVDKKIPNTRGLTKKSDCHTNIIEIGTKIPSVTGLETTAALNY